MAFEQRESGQLLLHGAAGGIVAGIVFILFEMIVAMLMGASFFAPLRLIGSMALGPEALSPAFPAVTAVATGTIVHLVLSAIYGIVFVYLLASSGRLGSSTALLLVYGSVFGLGLWVINFLIIAPIVWPQFAIVDQFWMGFVAHTFLYGTVLGAYVAAAMHGRAGAIV